MSEMRVDHGPDWPLTTRWRILGIPNSDKRLSIELSVDTVAEPVVHAIEQAAEENGIRLERR